MRSSMFIVLSLAVAAAPVAVTAADDSLQFRGPQRNGIFPGKNLLRSWPEEGPEILWIAQGLGAGFASAVTAGDRLYTTGLVDGREYLIAFDDTGKELWRTDYGQAHDGSGYPGTRTTPTVHGDRVFVMSSYGVLVCAEAGGGKIVWSVDTLSRFGGAKGKAYVPRWAIAESVLILGDTVICTPGVPGATLAALDLKTGDTVWTTKGLEEVSGYCSPRLFDNGKLRQIITMTGSSIVGVAPDTGKLLWHHPYSGSWEIHANSPLFHDNILYVSDGYGKGGTAFRLADDGSGIKTLWTEETLDIHHGGGVLLDGRIYGASNRGKWISLDITTGDIKAEGRGTGKGSVVYADGMLYGYGESGRLGLIDPKSADLAAVSMCRVEPGNGQHWAHPTISNGRLYIRHGDALICYAISAD